MEQIKKHNRERYDEYQRATEKYRNNFKASGYCSLSAWRLRRVLLSHMIQKLDFKKLDVLDMGCNNGLTGRELCNEFNRNNVEVEIDGIDFVESALDIARTTFDYRKTYLADITDKELINSLLGDRTYPLVHCCEVFHYINPGDYENLFETVNSHLSPGGFFLLVIPNVRSITHLIVKALKRNVYDGSFKYDYDVPYLNSLFEENGLDIVSICGAEILTKLIINLDHYSKIRGLFSYEIAILAKKRHS